jgi:tight adherence protein C
MAITLILLGILGFSKFSLRRISLPREEGQVKKTKMSRYINALPFIQNFLARLKLDVKIKNKLDVGRVNITPGQFVSIKLVLMFLAGLASFFALGRVDPLILFISVGLGYLLPDFWLRKKISQRKYAIGRVVPETIDLLGLCVEAGLDFTTAVKWIIDKKVSTNPMVEELTVVLEEIRWGKPRSQALKDMAHRLNIPEVSSFVQALVQAERMGTPVSETFNIISEDTRLQRFRTGERFALQAPIKILIPLIFCILPVIGIVIGGPILLQFMQGGISGFAK